MSTYLSLTAYFFIKTKQTCAHTKTISLRSEITGSFVKRTLFLWISNLSPLVNLVHNSYDTVP
jgi:hypothetical protein